MDNVRKEFEVWAKNNHWSISRSRINSDLYAHAYAQCGWQAWKASRSSLCVELPCGYIGHPYRNDILSAIDEVRVELDMAGVEYK